MLNEISIEIIRKCPNSCVYCSSGSGEFCTDIISFEKFREVIDDAKTLGAKIICLSGGEPFLHPDIIKMAYYVYQKGLSCYIYTSGITLDKDQNRKALPQDILNTVAGKIDKLIFNVEASTEFTYDKIMGTQGCFQLLQESIMRSNRLSIITEAHFVPMKLNANEIDTTVLLCEGLGITKVSFLRLVLHGRALSNKGMIALSDDELAALKKRLQQLKSQNKLSIRLGVPLSNTDNQHTCEAARGKLNIKYDGNVFPCEVFKNDSVNLEFNGYRPQNIYKNTLKDIYFNSEYLKYIRFFVQEYSCGKNCESCVGQYLIKRAVKGAPGSGQQR